MKNMLVSPAPVPAMIARRCDRMVAEAMVGCDTITSRALAGRSTIIDLLSPSWTWRGTGLAVAMVRCVAPACATEASDSAESPASSIARAKRGAERGGRGNDMGRILACRLFGRGRRGSGRLDRCGDGHRAVGIGGGRRRHHRDGGRA